MLCSLHTCWIQDTTNENQFVCFYIECHLWQHYDWTEQTFNKINGFLQGVSQFPINFHFKMGLVNMMFDPYLFLKSDVDLKKDF